MAIVYRHIRLDKNEVFYIGISNHDDKRPYNKRNRNNIWKKIINKTEYEVEILFDDLTLEQAKEKEIEFIKLYGRIDLGTGTLANLTDGGDGTLNCIVKKETRDKIRNTLKGNIPINKGKKGLQSHTEEWKEKMSIRTSGEFNPNYGVPCSEDKKRKISESKKGKTYPYKKSQVVKCPNCNKEGGIRNMKRYHFDNCKNKNKTDE